MIESNNFFWHECTVTGFIQSFRNFKFHTAVAGGEGFVKRNAFTPNYLQIIAPTIEGKMYAWYIKDLNPPLSIGKRISPEEPNRLWRILHNIPEKNNSLEFKEAYAPK